MGVAQEVRLLPTEFTLDGPENIQRLSVVNIVQGQLAGMIRATDLQFNVSDPSIVEIKDGVVRGLADGETDIHVKTGNGSTASARVKVSNANQQTQWSNTI